MENCFCSAVSILDLSEYKDKLDLVNVQYLLYITILLKHLINRALSLPPHRSYDCAIDLLPGVPLPSSRLYNLSDPEKETMRIYIEEFLALGITRFSTCHVVAGFFLWKRKTRPLNFAWKYTQSLTFVMHTTCSIK